MTQVENAEKTLGCLIHNLPSMMTLIDEPVKQTQPSPAEMGALIKLHKLGQFAELEKQTQLLIEQHPNAGLLWKLLGSALSMQHKDALHPLQKTAALLPKDAEAHNNLGIALQELGQLDTALNSYKNALEVAPNFALAYYNLGNVLCELAQPKIAVTYYRKALTLNPDFSEAHYNLGDALLSLGQYSEGWQQYEYRMKDLRSQQLLSATQLPQWRGQKPAPHERLLVLEEQGWGDKLQFARYLELAIERFPGGVGFVVGSPLQKLMRRSFPKVEILDDIPINQAAWHWQCPLLSLPLAFDTTLTTIPKKTAYLAPDPVRVTYWKTRVAALEFPSNTLKIGIVWRPGALMKSALQRTLTLQQIAPLLNHPSCAWFSLQKEPDPDTASWVASRRLIDWSDEFLDFDETAALAANLNCVISVDTSVVHLAGGLGIPTWLFNRHASEWRWMHNRESSPWYPSLRIFSQKNAGNWDEVVNQMNVVLTELLAQTR